MPPIEPSYHVSPIATHGIESWLGAPPPESPARIPWLCDDLFAPGAIVMDAPASRWVRHCAPAAAGGFRVRLPLPAGIAVRAVRRETGAALPGLAWGFSPAGRDRP